VLCVEERAAVGGTYGVDVLEVVEGGLESHEFLVDNEREVEVQDDAVVDGQPQNL
jgi:hypothetical protein